MKCHCLPYVPSLGLSGQARFLDLFTPFRLLTLQVVTCGKELVGPSSWKTFHGLISWCGKIRLGLNWNLPPCYLFLSSKGTKGSAWAELTPGREFNYMLMPGESTEMHVHQNHCDTAVLITEVMASYTATKKKWWVLWHTGSILSKKKHIHISPSQRGLKFINFYWKNASVWGRRRCDSIQKIIPGLICH